MQRPTIALASLFAIAISTALPAQELLTNGDFESGQPTPWNVTGSWQINNGSYDPVGPQNPQAAIGGSYDMLVDPASPGTSTIWQSFSVPTGVQRGEVRWDDAIFNLATSYANPGQQFEVAIEDSNGATLQQLFTTNPGDANVQPGPNSRCYDVTELLQNNAGNSLRLRVSVSTSLNLLNVYVDNISVMATTGTTGVAAFTAYGQGCGGSADDSFHEDFGPGGSPWDLNVGAGFTMLPAAPFAVIPLGATATVPPTGTPMTFGSDDTQPIALPFAFPFDGGTINTVYLCSNGWLAFEPTTDTDSSASIFDMLNGPARLAFHWSSLWPHFGGTIHAEVDSGNSGIFHVTFTGVPGVGNGATGTADVQVSLYSSGQIDVKYGAAANSNNLVPTLVGYSRGHGSLQSQPVDLSSPTLSLALSQSFTPDLALTASASNAPCTYPVLGTTFNMDVTNIPATAPIGVIIYSLVKIDPGLSLAAVGMPSCFAYAALDVPLTFTTSGPTHTYGLALPNTPTLAGTSVVTQAALLGMTTISPSGIGTSNGGEMLLGTF